MQKVHECMSQGGSLQPRITRMAFDLAWHISIYLLISLLLQWQRFFWNWHDHAASSVEEDQHASSGRHVLRPSIRTGTLKRRAKPLSVSCFTASQSARLLTKFEQVHPYTSM